MLQRWQQSQDVEEKIALGEQLVAQENQTTWPADVDAVETKADVRFGLGSAFLARAKGVRAENLEKAIAHLDAALALWPRQAAPENWAVAHNNLGMAYWARIQGQRADNQERAAAHFASAMTVFKREAYPVQWAQLQNNLAVMYWNRTHGDKSENLEKAIAHFEAALTVFTKASHAHQWAAAQNNLGSAYRSRRQGDRAANREKAITHLQAALGVFTRETYPHEWGQAQNNLAICYLDRVRGDRSENREKGIAALNAALTVLTPEGYPNEWAHAQHNLGIAYSERPTGDRAENRARAIAALEAALRVFTRELDPHQHLRTSRLLARTLSESGEWDKAAPHFASAREAFLLLFGEGLDEVATRALIGDGGPMFAEAAFAAVQRGRTDLALELANEGRARMLAVTLRLQTLDLSPDQAARAHDLRGSIRSAQQELEQAQGVERAAALEKLVASRQELLGILKLAGQRAEFQSAIAKARKAMAGGGAVVVPVVTNLGASILLVTGSAGQERIDALALPADTSEKLFVLLRGPRKDPRLTGWLGAYFINQLQGDEFNRRWPEWMGAIDKVGAELWGVFGAQLSAALKARAVAPGARLVFLPPGDLGVLPLALTQDPASRRRLVDDYETVYSPSLDVLAAAHDVDAGPTPGTLAAIINPTGDLPGTENEGRLVASYFPGERRAVLEGKKATVEGVLAALKGKTHWHFASHGTFSWQDARQSALVMHGRTMLSVGRLLETEGLGRPRLVVLSACETGLYDLTSIPDEFIGLPGTFSALGAAGVIGTLWPVSDAATALLMAKFYELYLDSKLSPPSALHRAQKWLRQATRVELEKYAQTMAAKGQLAARQRDLLTSDMQQGANARSRIGSAQTPRAPAGQKGSDRAAPRQTARPYAHPYFWAGFVFTGL
jgi:CHAT domain-containing protein/tetratricopeptide (TPR) repeat protein